jgi:predicted RNA binding protein YcfA (HicA-like mRNA interferase family)
VFKHPDGRKVVVPCHRTQSIGVARGIARMAGWM